MLKSIYHSITPVWLRKKKAYFFFLNIPKYKRLHTLRIRQIQKTKSARVLFLAGELSMWRYQGIYELLAKDPRFDIKIAIHPPIIREQETTSKKLEEYFKSHNMPCVNATEAGFNHQSFLDKFDPDIIFYCQPYSNAFNNALEYENNKHRLLAYIPYGLITVNNDWAYNGEFQNIAWRIYQASELHKQTARRICVNKGENIVVTGEPHADDFAQNLKHDPWKTIPDKSERKKIIWAAHASIQKISSLGRNSFLWLNEQMIEIASKFEDNVQFVFKPHPYLYNSLIDLWGKTKTDEYYNRWRNGYNTQLETGDFIELFKSSDGMIHDCGSFTAEYLFTESPVIFMSKDMNTVRGMADDFGNRCLDMHYIGNDSSDVENFIKEIVIGEKDPMSKKRTAFKKDMLTPPNGKSVAFNIYTDILQSLGL